MGDYVMPTSTEARKSIDLAVVVRVAAGGVDPAARKASVSASPHRIASRVRLPSAGVPNATTAWSTAGTMACCHAK